LSIRLESFPGLRFEWTVLNASSEGCLRLIREMIEGYRYDITWGDRVDGSEGPVLSVHWQRAMDRREIVMHPAGQCILPSSRT
jgi:hypothetical protein